MGNAFYNQNEIKVCFLDFYSKLWTSSSNSLYRMSHSMLNDFDILYCDDKNLWSNIWLKKIFATLGSMPRCRSPALDGLKVDFYLFYWNKVHGCLFKAISHFFLTYRMPKYCGNTYVALIPWLDSNIFVFDFWPIPLCKVCYKSSIKSWSIALKMWLYISCSWAK